MQGEKSDSYDPEQGETTDQRAVAGLTYSWLFEGREEKQKKR